MFEATLDNSIIGRAKNKGLVEINYIQIRNFSKNKHRKVDDYPYGGGQGMVMQAQPIFDAYMSVADGLGYKPYTIYMSPQGKQFRQSTAKRFAKKEHIVILCGHYEGVDQRVIDEIIDDEISLGDFVLTGGETAAIAVVDATARLIPGVLKSDTRPEVWHDRRVPDVLLSGHHKNILAWKRKTSIINTFNKRRGMLAKAKLSAEEREFVERLKQEKSGSDRT